MARESTIVSNIRKMLTARGYWSEKTHGDEVASGKPDIYACCNGRFVALEVKRPGEKATPIQLYELARLRRAGALVGVVCSVGEAEDVLREADL